MDTTRQHKIARLIQKELSDIFQKEGKNFYGSSMVTITAVSVTKDLSIARVHVSIFSLNNIPKDDVLKAIKANATDIRFILGTKIKNQVRIIPMLEFFIDNSFDHVERIEQLLNQ